jgi:hypothetical protein
VHHPRTPLQTAAHTRVRQADHVDLDTGVFYACTWKVVAHALDVHTQPVFLTLVVVCVDGYRGARAGGGGGGSRAGDVACACGA